MTDNIVDFVKRKAGVRSNGKIVKPEFCFAIFSSDVDMSGHKSFIRIKEGSVRSRSQDCRHSHLQSIDR